MSELWPHDLPIEVPEIFSTGGTSSRKILTFVWASMGKEALTRTLHILAIYFKSGMQPIGMVTNGYKGLLLS